MSKASNKLLVPKWLGYYLLGLILFGLVVLVSVVIGQRFSLLIGFSTFAVLSFIFGKIMQLIQSYYEAQNHE
jgi:ABC-type dipeptide/oligopeptide/nickel transport system permease subunit